MQGLNARLPTDISPKMTQLSQIHPSWKKQHRLTMLMFYDPKYFSGHVSDIRKALSTLYDDRTGAIMERSIDDFGFINGVYFFGIRDLPKKNDKKKPFPTRFLPERLANCLPEKLSKVRPIYKGSSPLTNNIEYFFPFAGVGLTIH
jgi:hypothetical protein